MFSRATLVSGTLATLLVLATPAAALCKPVVGIEVFRDDWAFTIPCGKGDCNSPATTVTIYHPDRTTTAKTVPGILDFSYKEKPALTVDEWDFFGKYKDDPGNFGFHVYAARCPTLPENQGYGCLEKALRVERGHIPFNTWQSFKCGNTFD